MGFLERVRDEADKMLRQQQGLSQVLSAGWLSGSLMPPRRRGEQYLKAFGQMPWLRATLHRAAMVFGRTTWQLKSGETLIDSHPALNLMKFPNSRWPGMWMRYLIDVHLWLRGEAFWLIERNGAGLPGELIPIPPHWVLTAPPLKDKEFEILWYTEHRRVPPNDIVWFSEPDPANPLGRGLGAVESLADELDSDEYAAQWNKVLFFNKGIPEILVSLKGMTKSQLQEFGQEWELKHGTHINARRPGFVNADVKVEKLMGTPQDMDFINLREFARDTIISVIGVPPEVVGVLKNSNRATIEAAEYFFTKFLVEPRLEAFQGVLNSQLLRYFPNSDRLSFEFISPVPKDKEFELKAADTGVTKTFMKVNEARKKIGLDPTPDGDVWLMTGITFPTDSLENAPPSMTPAPGSPAAALVPRARVLENLAEHIFDVNIEFKYMWAVLGPRYRAIIEMMGQKAVQDAKGGRSQRQGEEIPIDEFVWSPAVEEFLQTTAGIKIKNEVIRNTLTDLQKALHDGIVAGEGLTQLMDRISQLYLDYKGYRSERVARTEVIRASAWATEEGYTQAGVEYKEWIATRDERTRDSHAETDGQVVEIGENFTLGSGVETPGPGQSGIAEEDINCRCAIAPSSAPESPRSLDQRAAMWRAYDGTVRGLERLFRTSLIKEFQSQQRRVTSRLKSLLGS